MKKLALILTMSLASAVAMAQTPYKTSLGLGIDLKKNHTFFGPQVKHVFGKNGAIQGQAMFSKYDFWYLGADYQYVKNFPNTKNFAYYLGVGPQLGFHTNSSQKTEFTLRPQAGVELKLPEVPLAVHADWKPWWKLSNGQEFLADNFTLGIKYVIK